MRIEIWSDVACPWCYIGKRRLEAALRGVPASTPGFRAEDVQVVYRSFQLDPGAPSVPTETAAEALGRKYGGGPEAGRQMMERVDAVAAQEGLAFRQSEALRVNTFDAHRLLHLGLAEGVQAELKEALLSAYFVEARNVADHDELVALTARAGIGESRVRAVLGSDEYADEVRADIAEAASLGANGVPFFVIDRRFGVSGAQPVEAFVQVLQRAWAQEHPRLDLVGGDEATCGPDGCAL